MRQIACNYAQVLWDMKVSPQDLEETRQILKSTSELPQILNSPIVSIQEKRKLIDRIFPESVHGFLKVVCEHKRVEALDEIFQAYEACEREAGQELEASLYCAAQPDESQLMSIKESLKKRYKVEKIQLHVIIQKELISGFVIRVGDQEIDWSLKGRLTNIRNQLIRR